MTRTCGMMTRMAATPIGRSSWEPATPAEVAEIFSSCEARWWIAGGYAIELATGQPIRDHSDIDVLLLRRDQLVVQEALPGWQWRAADPPGSLRPWRPGEQLPAGVHDIWCRPGPRRPWRIQVMLEESSGGDWISRRDERIRRPITSIGLVTARGIPYLAPEIQLFYKAKNQRAKDEADFAATLPILTEAQKRWLSHALSLVYGPAHPWRLRLRHPVPRSIDSKHDQGRR
jgi:hypothetical protein